MERNRDTSGPMAGTPRDILANQCATEPTSNNTSSDFPGINMTLELRPSYPLTTTHYGECRYLSEYEKPSPSKADKPPSSSPHSALFQSHRASPPMSRRDPTPPSPLHNHFTKEDYERMVKENVRLKLELEAAKETAEKATKACRDLAAWTLWERNRLLREVEKAQEAHRAFINDEVDQLMADESCLPPSCK